MDQKPDKHTSDFIHPPPPNDTDLEHVWEFAGQRLDSGNFTNAMIHFYRGEMTRSNSWRQRLDATTNWAVITTGAALTFVFSEPGNTASMNNVIHRLRHVTWDAFETEIPRLARFDTRKQLAYIVSDQIEAESKLLLKELGRGVTLINAKGMYTGQEHGVLMCALEARQKSQLKRLVYQADPQAFVILTPAEDVRGGGFRPLET